MKWLGGGEKVGLTKETEHVTALLIVKNDRALLRLCFRMFIIQYVSYINQSAKYVLLFFLQARNYWKGIRK